MSSTAPQKHLPFIFSLAILTLVLMIIVYFLWFRRSIVIPDLYILGGFLFPQIQPIYHQKKFSKDIKYVLLLDDQTEGKKEEGLRGEWVDVSLGLILEI